MNYEEMLQSRDGVASHRDQLPLGIFYKKLIDKKYRNVVELKPELIDSIVFCEALKADMRMTEGLAHPGQLHFKANADSSGIYELELEAGNYQTFRQLLTNTPAVVTGKNYTDRVVEQLASILQCLHAQSTFQYCLSPQTVFARKNDNMPMLLWHGSFYKNLADKSLLYKGFEDDVAPEVLSVEEAVERADVFALGRFISHLHDDGSIPYEYKSVVAKATSPNPADRYATIDEMVAAVSKKRSSMRSVIAAVAAFVIALLCIVVYIDLMPEQMDMEYVKTDQESGADPYDAALTPMELGLDVDDDTLSLSDDELTNVQTELENTFRRQFKREAEKVYSKLYNEERINPSGQTFKTPNRTIIDDLLRKRDEIAQQAGLSADIAEAISRDVMDELMAEKKLMLNNYGFQHDDKKKK